MAIRKREIDGIVVLDVSGEYYGGKETDALDRAITTELALGNRQLVLNLAECRGMNSSALGVLLGSHRVADRIGGSIRLCCAQPRMKNLLHVLHVQELVAHYDSEEEALAALGRRATA